MYKLCTVAGIVLLLSILPRTSVQAQSFELAQLILNVEKLSQLKAILSQMKKGYQILTTGYNTVRDLSEGNFSLHKAFLDGLLKVSPTVRKYKRVTDIVIMQQKLIRQYRHAFAIFTEADVFNETELEYIEKVYGGLFDRSMKNLDELLMVITAGELRMNDAERLRSIDRIYDDMKDKTDFLNHFNKKTTLLGLQRQKELSGYRSLEQLNSK